MSVSFCRVKFLIRQRIRVLFPTLGGPTTTITIGGGSRGVRSTTGTWCFLVFMSWALFEEQTKINTNTVWRHELDSSYYVMHNTDLWKVLAMRTADWTANALGLRLRSSSSVEPFCFFSFFFSAFGPLCFCWCCFCFLTFPSILSATHTAPCVHMQFDWDLWTENRFTQFIGMDRRHQLHKKKRIHMKIGNILIWFFSYMTCMYNSFAFSWYLGQLWHGIIFSHNMRNLWYISWPFVFIWACKACSLWFFPHITKTFSQILWRQNI